MKTEAEKILLVDDDQDILDGLTLNLGRRYSVVAALGPEEGLKALAEQGPFAVVVTDYQMPGMNGVQFLARAMEQAPHMVRVMLTGQADLRTAIEAVNRGQIFRFLSKPCELKTMRACLEAALDQWRLRDVERHLLEKTLQGSVEVLAEVLALTNPTAFGKATRLRELVRHIVGVLQPEQAWQYETAALLSQIGYVAIPDDLLGRAAKGLELSPAESSMLEHHPKVARDLLKKIPRLELVAEMVYHQSSASGASVNPAISLGSQMLAAASEWIELLASGAAPQEALKSLRRSARDYDVRILDALETAQTSAEDVPIQNVTVHKLKIGMLLQDDIHTCEGNLIVGIGHCVTEGSLLRLRNFAQLGRLDTLEFRVL